MNREGEIRKLLGNRFHLCVSYEQGFDNPKWSLFKNYLDSEIYYSKDNKIIMSSETHSIDDLYDFAKKHHKIDEHQVILKTAIGVSYIFLILLTINIVFIHSDFIRSFILGADFIIMLYSIICHHVWKKNHNVTTLELMENFKRLSIKNRENQDDRESTTK